MATQLRDDELQDDDDQEIEVDGQDNDADPPEGDDGSEGDDDDADDEQQDDDEDVITFGGADIRGEDEPEHIADLRRRYREEKKRREELEARSVPQDEDIGPKPSLDDFWDQDDPEAAYDAARDAWLEKKRAAEARAEGQRKQAEAAQKDWEDDLSAFETQRSTLKVGDFDAAYDKVTVSLSQVQQALVVQASNNKAALVYALGKNPERLAEIAKITNPVKFAAAVARLDMETKVERRKPTTQPESAARGSGAVSGGRPDAKLERLRKHYENTGEGTEYFAYKRQLRDAGKLKEA